MRRISLTTALLIAMGCGGEDTDPPPIGTIDYHVVHYDYAFDIETRAAAVTLTIDVIEGGDCIEIPLRAGGLGEVTLGGSPITSGSLLGTVLTACGEGWESGSQITMTANMEVALDTWAQSQVGYSVSTDLLDNPFHYMVSWVGGCDRFGPCDALPDRFARYTFTVNHPSGMQVFCPGTITHGDTTTVCDFDHDGGPSYSTFGIAAGPSWVESDLGTWNGVKVTLHDTPGSEIAETFELQNVKSFFEWMETTFGPYPYGNELRFVVAPTYWGGFEHPGNIVLSDSLVQISGQGAGLTGTTMHEIGHMWAGDQTTLASTHDFVWKEAMVEYFVMIHEETIDPARAAATARGWKSGALRFDDFYPVPGEQPELLDFYGHVYGAGPMILFRQLEALYDRASVIAALKTLLGSPRTLSVVEVKEALALSLGVDLDTYFATWVNGSGSPVRPVYTVTITDRGSGTYDVGVDQVNASAGPFGCAFAIKLTGDGASDEHEVWIDLGVDGKLTHTVTGVTPGFAVTGHELDPHSHSLATEPTSSVAPKPAPTPWLAHRPLVPFVR